MLKAAFWLSSTVLYLASALWFYIWWGGIGLIISLFTFIPIFAFPLLYLFREGLDYYAVCFMVLWIVAMVSGIYLSQSEPVAQV